MTNVGGDRYANYSGQILKHGIPALECHIAPHIYVKLLSNKKCKKSSIPVQTNIYLLRASAMLTVCSGEYWAL